MIATLFGRQIAGCLGGNRLFCKGFGRKNASGAFDSLPTRGNQEILSLNHTAPALSAQQSTANLLPMLLRTVLLLVVMIAASVGATLYFGESVIVAFGLLLVQLKLLSKKVALLDVAAVLAWLKLHAGTFFRIELIKKWVMTTVVPLMVGKAALRRLAGFIRSYTAILTDRYEALLKWYGDLNWIEKTLAATVVIVATFALGVSTLGLWLVLFSVKIPLWLAAAAAALGRMVWVTVQKTVFKTLAFLQLRWLWAFLRKLLPARFLRWKHKLDYRIARAVIRRRRMSLRQVAERKDSLPFRIGLMADFLLGRTER